MRFDRSAPPLAPAPPSLFDHGLAPVPVTTSSAGTIEEAFLRFHEANPWVYEALVRLARDLHRRGRRKIGMKMLFEVLRWQHSISTVDESSDFKLCNNYTSRYARLIMRNEADLVDIFETRKLVTP